MKIIYIANIRLPTEKAHGLQIVKTCEAFVKRGVEVKLVLPWRFNQIKKDPFEYYGVEKIFKIIKLPSLDFILWFGKLGFWLQSLTFSKSAAVYSLFKKCDVFYSRDIVISFFLSLFGKNVVFEDHEPLVSKKWLYKYFLKKIKKKVLVARNLVELYKKFGIDERSYTVAPNGVDLKEFDRVQSDKTIWQKQFDINLTNKVVLYVGHFYEWKGVYTFLESVVYLEPTTKIVLIGGTEEDKKRISEYIKEKKIKNVFIKGFVSHPEIIKYIKSADVLVLPNTAQEERSAKYTTPIKLFEYMASDVPIVASDVESFSGYLKNNKNALLFTSDDSKDLAKKISHLLSDDDLTFALSQQAKMDAQDYTWDKRAEKILKFI